MPRSLPCPILLRQLLTYEPDTGKLFWRKRAVSSGVSEGETNRWNTRHAGKPALACLSRNGCLHGSVMSVPLLSHRVAWALHYGRWPDGEIDHINGNRADNRISNLRDVRRVDNNKNAKRRKDNSSGFAGVYKCKNRYLAHIRIDGEQKIIGRFNTPEEAHAFREKEKMKYGYHKNHGRD